MPTYVYKFVETGETIEVQQSFTDATLTEVAHPESGELMAVKKVFTPVGVTFKGSGFFKTDNRGGSKSESTASTSSSSDSTTSSTSTSTTTNGSTPDKSDPKPAASTPAASSGSSST